MRRTQDFIPFHIPTVGEEEINAVLECLKSGWLTTGPEAKAFEEEFAEYVGAAYALAVSSCTAGLHLALEALGIGRGDQVVTTPYTFTASAEVIRYLGADPIFIDVDPRTFNIRPEAVEEVVKCNSVKAILPVHMAGQARQARWRVLNETGRQERVFPASEVDNA